MTATTSLQTRNHAVWIPARASLAGTTGCESALQQRFDLLVEFLERGRALDHLAVDEESRRRVDLQHLAGKLLVGGDLVEQRLILQAVLDRLLAEPGLLADPGQGLGG